MRHTLDVTQLCTSRLWSLERASAAPCLPMCRAGAMITLVACIATRRESSRIPNRIVSYRIGSDRIGSVRQSSATETVAVCDCASAVSVLCAVEGALRRSRSRSGSRSPTRNAEGEAAIREAKFPDALPPEQSARRERVPIERDDFPGPVATALIIAEKRTRRPLLLSALSLSLSHA